MSGLCGHLSVHYCSVWGSVCESRRLQINEEVRKRKGRTILPACKPLYFITRMRKLIRTETPPVALLGHQFPPLREEVYRWHPSMWLWPTMLGVRRGRDRVRVECHSHHNYQLQVHWISLWVCECECVCVCVCVCMCVYVCAGLMIIAGQLISEQLCSNIIMSYHSSEMCNDIWAWN